MNEDDLVRLRHRRDAAREVIEFIEGRTRQSLDIDRLLVRGLSMSVGIIGEAAAHVSQETQDAYPQIPWAQIVGMRNRLIHAYFDIKLDRLWDTVTYSVPGLLVELEKLIPPEQDAA
jgi:uncharacterized protein with HEPN domain